MAGNAHTQNKINNPLQTFPNGLFYYVVIYRLLKARTRKDPEIFLKP